MKISLAQAIATILNIQVEQVLPTSDRHGHQIFVGTFNGIPVKLGEVGIKTLEQAVWKAMEVANLQNESNFALFPLGSGRESIYMAIERELLRQEVALETQMWQQLGNDPREIITLIMEQLRGCATALTNPSSFQIALLRVCCLCVASMQWVSDWLTKLRVQAAVLQTQREEKQVSVPQVFDDDLRTGQHQQEHEETLPEPPPPLFGAGGPGALKVVPAPEPVVPGSDEAVRREVEQSVDTEGQS